MRKIKLSNSTLVALVDDSDFEFLSRFKWCLRKAKCGTVYPQTMLWENGKKRSIAMHQLISDYERTDHKDRNGLNNQRKNLRASTVAQNCWNSGARKNNRSGLKGVMFDKQRGKWKSKINANGKRFDLGRFNSKEDAAKAYNIAALKFHGKFAYQNQIQN